MPSLGESAYRIGCSGRSYGAWRHGVFYPERLPAPRRLEHDASRFDTAEVNATFDWEGFAPAAASRLQELLTG